MMCDARLFSYPQICVVWAPSNHRAPRIMSKNTNGQQQFVERRLAAHRAGTAQIETDWLVKAAMEDRRRTGPVRVSDWEKKAFCFSEGWQTRRQAD